jgi:hypothetical protein
MTVVMRPSHLRARQRTVVPTLTGMRSAVSGWQVRDGIAFLALIVVYRFRFTTLRRLILLVAAVISAFATYMTVHSR